LEVQIILYEYQMMIVSFIDKYRVSFFFYLTRYFEYVPIVVPVSPVHFFRKFPANFLKSSWI